MSRSTHGYELATHALVTYEAYKNSTLNPETDGSIVPIIGIERLSIDQPFAFLGQPNSTPYYDDVAVDAPTENIPPLSFSFSVPRSVQGQERTVLDDLTKRNYLFGEMGAEIEQRLASWLMRGAIREDDNDYKIFGHWTTGDDRDPDPYGPIFRAFRHFYDPLFYQITLQELRGISFGSTYQEHLPSLLG